MTDIAVEHTMTTPGGVIVFNDLTAVDRFFLNAVPGLGGVAARVTKAKLAFTDGAYIPNSFKTHREFQPQGTLLILSTTVPNEIVAIRNDMEELLRVAYESLGDADGMWAWTPRGDISERALTIRRDDQPCEFTHVDGYQNVDFSFGLVAGSPDWTGGGS